MNKLTNIDIVDRLLTIRKMENACTRTEALQAFEKEYKQTSFYKRTHKKLLTLYYEVAIEDILTFTSLLKNAQNFINNLDAEHLVQILDQINAQAKQTYNEEMANLVESGLGDLLASFKKA